MARPANDRKYDFSSEAPQVAAEVISELFSQQSRQKRGGGERERKCHFRGNHGTFEPQPGRKISDD